MTGQDRLGIAPVVVFLVIFAANGVKMMIDPDPFVRRSGLPKGGEMLKTWNRDSMRLAGAVFVAAAIYLLYQVLFR